MKVNKYLLNLKLEEDKYIIINLLNQKAFYCDKEVKDALSTKHIDTLPSSILDTLKELGIILPYDYEYIGQFQQMAKKHVLNPNRSKFYGFEIILNWNCNFACNFCIQRKNWGQRESISHKKIKKILEFIDMYGNKPPHVAISGGEPLLIGNYGIIERLLRYLADENGELVITTNGFTLPKYLHLFEKYHSVISSIRISIAGPQEIHDKKRVHKTGAPTFNIVFGNLKKAMKTELLPKLRIVTHFDQENIPYLDKWVKILLEEGILGKIPVMFSVVENGGNINSQRFEEYKNREYISKKLIKYFSQNTWALKYIEVDNGTGEFEIIKNIILHGMLPNVRLYPCNGLAGRGAVMAPDGYVYPCVILAREKTFRIGKYYPVSEIFWDSITKIRSRNLTTLNKCHSCPLLPICSGGCPFKDLSKKELEKVKQGLITITDCVSCMNKSLMENEVSQLFFEFKKVMGQRRLNK